MNIKFNFYGLLALIIDVQSTFISTGNMYMEPKSWAR